MKIYGLIGKTLTHSFSPRYFASKFEREKIGNSLYSLFPIGSIDEFPSILKDHPEISGLNVTIPYKQSIIKYLDKLDVHSKEIGAVNTIKIEYANGKQLLIGFNTDYLGFTDSIKPLIVNKKTKALILGTGGSSVAVAYALKGMNIEYLFVSRNPEHSIEIGYYDLTKKLLDSYTIIINTTPLGMFPKIDDKPPIPYQFLTKDHILFDLIYNPDETLFLKMGKKFGCQTKNGLEMLGYQAEYSWNIWNNL